VDSVGQERGNKAKEAESLAETMKKECASGDTSANQGASEDRPDVRHYVSSDQFTLASREASTAP
jgi:hypothetical protein